MNEEILIKMGLDSRMVSTGLRSVRRNVEEWSGGIKHSIKEAFSGLLAPLTGAGIIVTLERTAERVKKLRAEAEASGTSISFLQDLQNVGRAAGVADEKVTTMLNKFVKGLPAGSDVEREFYRMADKLASIPDPAERARVAVEAFGKSGMEMVMVAGQGSAALKELAGEFSKISDAEADSFERASREVEKFQNKLWMFTVKAVAGYSQLLKTAYRYGAYGMSVPWSEVKKEQIGYDSKEFDEGRAALKQANLSKQEQNRQAEILRQKEHAAALESQNALAQVTLAEKLTKLEQDRAWLAAYVADQRNDEVERAKAAVEFAKVDIECRKTAKEIDKDRTEEAKKQREEVEKTLRVQKEVSNAQVRSIEAHEALATAKGDRSKFTLGELAADNIGYNTTPEMAQQIMKARQVQALEQRGRYLASLGYDDKSQEFFNKADQIRGGLSALTGSERNPFAVLQKSVENTDRNTAELVKQITGGIKVVAVYDD